MQLEMCSPLSERENVERAGWRAGCVRKLYARRVGCVQALVFVLQYLLVGDGDSIAEMGVGGDTAVPSLSLKHFVFLKL